MIPQLVSGIASVANNLIDKWAGASERKVAVEHAKFEQAFGKAMAGGKALADSPVMRAEKLRASVLDAPEVKSALSAQDPARPASLQISRDGKLWLQRTDGSLPVEVHLAPETQELVRQLA